MWSRPDRCANPVIVDNPGFRVAIVVVIAIAAGAAGVAVALTAATRVADGANGWTVFFWTSFRYQCRHGNAIDCRLAAECFCPGARRAAGIGENQRAIGLAAFADFGGAAARPGWSVAEWTESAAWQEARADGVFPV